MNDASLERIRKPAAMVGYGVLAAAIDGVLTSALHTLAVLPASYRWFEPGVEAAEGVSTTAHP
jgi:hypothetical protein